MGENPRSLKDLCIESVSNNIDQLYVVQPTFDDDNLTEVPVPMFIDNNTYLPREVAEILLTQLSSKNKLNDTILSLFNHKNAYLRNVVLPRSDNLTKQGLSTLEKHKIIKLEINGLKCEVNDFFDSLNEWTTQNLEILSVSKSSFSLNVSDLELCFAVSLSKFKNLHSLDVSNTAFNTNNLYSVLGILPNLKSLNISCTKVDSLLPFMNKHIQLQKLSAYNLRKATMHLIAFSSFQTMISLTHLDVSSERYPHPSLPLVGDLPWLQFLRKQDFLPNLVSLDISGSSIDQQILEDFVITHKKLRFLGLMYMEECSFDMFIVPTHPLYNSELVVTGMATEDQLLASLRCYIKRPFYIKHCLQYLFYRVDLYSSPRVDIIRLILNAMHCHHDSFFVQMSATACLYHFTKRNIGPLLHPSLLSEVVETTLDAMENFPNNSQLQKNTLMTLCTDRILKEIRMDRFKCAKLVLNSLYMFNDEIMDRTSVAICSILAAKISVSQASELGSNPKYIIKLLALVRNKLSVRTYDVTMKFTLSLLWNLTDESPATCKVFMEKGGLKLYLDVIEAFANNSIVEITTLGLISNIVEVPHLRSRVFEYFNIMPTLRRLLRSERVDISYFAAGIIAHLACDSAWLLYFEKSDKIIVLKELSYAVKRWVRPFNEMVSYRSLHPFINLLNSTDVPPQVQLWAVWAIHHVCSKNDKYCTMLVEENGIETIQKIASDKTTDPEVCELCLNILDMIEKFRNVSNSVRQVDSV